MDGSPPLPRLALAIGIVGHRPDRLPPEQADRDKIANKIGLVLDAIGSEANAALARYQEYFSNDRPIISVVSALAEGADRMAAHATIARGLKASPIGNSGAVFVLDAPLPFATDTYRDDFKRPESKAEFDYLLTESRSVLGLPGARGAQEAQSYEIVGQTVLSQADILLIVYDGGESHGRGGTTDMVSRAIRAGMPIIHIDVKGDANPRIRWDGLSAFPSPSAAFTDLPAAHVEEVLPCLMDVLLRPPTEKPGHHEAPTFLQPLSSERDWLRHYQQERFHRWNLYFTHTVLRAAFGRRPLIKSKYDWRPSGPHILAAELAAFDLSLPPERRLQTQSVLARAYGWADAIGNRFGQVFRSAFVTNFVFGAFAVVAAALSLVLLHPGEFAHMRPLDFAQHKTPFVMLEWIFIVVVVINTSIGRRNGWHRRWFEAREVAERLRVTLPLWILGMRPATNFADEEPTWTGWYARAIVREQGMKTGNLDAAGMQAAAATLTALLDNQCAYHHATAEHMKLMELNLERTGFILFVLTIAAATGFLVVVLGTHIELPVWVGFLVTALAAGFPALATATYGIRVIGDFEGIAHRSERTRLALDQIIKAIKAGVLDLTSLRARAQFAANIMLSDVSSWRLAAESRTLALPG